MGDGGGTVGAVGSPGSGADGKGSGNFDSYIGSLISLTSKSDIRYEGILYTIDAEKCNIALQNVRSYGTEGRKKEGPQIPPNDKVYDYIIFRGSDIKDLQVKSSPQVHAMHSQPYSDPAIIAQSQQSQQSQRISASVVTPPMGVPQPPTGIPQPLSGFSHPMGIPHGPVGVPSPSRDSSGHPGLLPPGFVSSSYPPAVGMGQWGPRPPPVGNGPMPIYWPGYYPPPTGSSMQPQYLQPLLPPEPPMQKLNHSLQDPTQGATANALVSGAVPAEPSRVLDKSRETASSSIGTGTGLTPIVKLPRLPSVSQVPLETPLEMPRDTAAPEPVPAEQISEPAKRAPDNSQQERPTSHPVPHHSSSSRDHQASENVRPHWRGNGRRGGRGRAGPTHRMQNFTEDFDFTAMNEKFKKDEVWGELGKVEPKNTEEEDLGDRNWQKAEELSIPKKPVYVKDDFFDSLSCDALDREGGHHERPRYSEQRKINTETFGDAFLRSRGGYRGNYKGGYHGRGGGYRRGRPHPAAGV